jgi:hypothetical protein
VTAYQNVHHGQILLSMAGLFGGMSVVRVPLS